jgi:hypothetical protein
VNNVIKVSSVGCTMSIHWDVSKLFRICGHVCRLEAWHERPKSWTKFSPYLTCEENWKVFIFPTAFWFKSCFERCMSSKCSFPKSESNRTHGIFPITQPQTTHRSHLTCTKTNTIWVVTEIVVLQHWRYWLDDSDTMTSGGRNLHCLPFWVLPVSSRTQNVIH